MSRIARSTRAPGSTTTSDITTDSTISAPLSTVTPGNRIERRTLPATRQPFAIRLSSTRAPSRSSTGGRSSSRVRIGQRWSLSWKRGSGASSSRLER